MKKKVMGIFLAVVLFVLHPLSAEEGHDASSRIQKLLARGWNTWHSRNVLSQVLLPECFSVNLAFKQHYWLDEKYLKEALIGRSGECVERIRPGLHALDGSYTELEIRWETLHARIETAVDGEDLVVLVTPLIKPVSPVKMIVETGMLWNRSGRLQKEDDHLKADLPGRAVLVYSTGEHVDDPYVETKTPYLSVFLDGPTGVSTGKWRGVVEIQRIVDEQRALLQQEASRKGNLSEVYLAVQAGLAWNTIYEPRHDRVVSTVGRLWNLEYGGYCLFGWDNFFLAYIASLFDKDLAFANAIEHLEGKTEEGFIPNDNRGNGSKSWDRSQPPVGSLMVREIYRRYPEEWFLEAVFDDLLAWNRWWMKRRLNEGLLSYGSHEAKNPFDEPAVRTKRTAGYESGMDDSPMYEGVPFNRDKNTMELHDVGLNSLVIADCEALAEMAHILGRKADEEELISRAGILKQGLETLWDRETGLYLNRRTDTGGLSRRLSPTLFYPLLARVPNEERARRMLEAHFYNPEEFWGEWMLPSIARNDSAFPRQRYWRGAVWPPLNFLVYIGLREYGMADAAEALSKSSKALFLNEWRRKGYVSENYSAITGRGDDARLSSDRFHSWGALLGMIVLIEGGYMPKPEDGLVD
jgi:hypothetical protein